jgi:hypothetical protein
MSEITEIIKGLPRWVFIVAVCVFVIFMILSLFLGTFKIGGSEFGFNLRTKDSIPEDSVYMVRGTVETIDRKPPYETVISLSPSPEVTAEGEIVGARIRRDSEGKLPTMNFSLYGYHSKGLDLNDKEKVEIKQDGKDLWLVLKKTIVLQPRPLGNP